MHPLHTYPLPGVREPLCSVSHILGAAAFAVLAVAFIRRGGGDRWRTICLAMMACSSVLLLATSGLYHMCWPGPLREFMVRADVSAVFLLIAGSLTPIYGILFQGAARWVPLLLIWGVTGFGIASRIVSPESSIGPTGVALFLAFGWGNAIVTVVMWRKYGWRFIKPGICAGLSYTFGAIVLMLHAPTVWHGFIGPHELWHAAVLSGMGFHWRFVSTFAGGTPEVLLPVEYAPVVLEFAPSEAFDAQAA